MTHDLDICSKLTSNLPEIQADNLCWKQKGFKVRFWSTSEFQFKLGLHKMTARCLYKKDGKDPSLQLYKSCIISLSTQRGGYLRYKINSRWLISLLLTVWVGQLKWVHAIKHKSWIKFIETVLLHDMQCLILWKHFDFKIFVFCSQYLYVNQKMSHGGFMMLSANN